METIENNVKLISCCGLYCKNCRAFIKGKCSGCEENSKATWCKIRACCMENGYKSCADCKEFADPMDCKKFNNFMTKIFAFVFRGDRAAGIALIKEKGYENFAAYMAENKLQVIRK